MQLDATQSTDVDKSDSFKSSPVSSNSATNCTKPAISEDVAASRKSSRIASCCKSVLSLVVVSVAVCAIAVIIVVMKPTSDLLNLSRTISTIPFAVMNRLLEANVADCIVNTGDYQHYHLGDLDSDNGVNSCSPPHTSLPTTNLEYSWAIELRSNYRTINSELNAYIAILKQNCNSVDSKQVVGANSSTATLEVHNPYPTWPNFITRQSGWSKGWRIYWLRAAGIDTDLFEQFPATKRLLGRVFDNLNRSGGGPKIWQIFMSELEPGGYVMPHRGVYKGVLRYHLGLEMGAEGESSEANDKAQGDRGTLDAPKVPKLIVESASSRSIVHPNNLKGKQSKLVQTHEWGEGEDYLFDDTDRHFVRNDSKSRRVILIIDVEREVGGIQHKFLGWLNRGFMEMTWMLPMSQEILGSANRWAQKGLR
jgi:hypothetical protein